MIKEKKVDSIIVKIWNDTHNSLILFHGVNVVIEKYCIMTILIDL